MSFRQLERFVATAECGSISRAAEQLNIVQPALSQSIRQLEKSVGADLFLRTRRGIELTAEGQTFLEHAYGILSQYSKARESVAAMHGETSGSVSIAMVSSAIDLLTVPVCNLLKERFPKIELDLEEGLVSNIQQGLEAGRYDFAISYLPDDNKYAEAEALIDEQLFLTTKYRGEPHSRYSDLDELRNTALIIPKERFGAGIELGQASKNLDFELVSSKFSGAIHPTLKLVKAGIGASLLPWSAVRDGLENSQLLVRAIRKPGLYQRVHMVHAAHKPITRATSAVMELVRESVRSVHQEGEWPGRLLV
ncbi:MAG: LysR family transcriptional regulator [Pseudomonadota bacterium]